MDVSSSSKDVMINPNDLDALRLQFAEKDAIYKRLQKEREAKKMNALIERESLLRKINELKERNKMLAFAPKSLQHEIFGDLDAFRSEKECMLEDHEFEQEGLVIRQVQSYASQPKDKNESETT